MNEATRWKLIRDNIPEHVDITEVRINRLGMCHPYTADQRLKVLTLINKIHEEAGEIAEKPYDVSEYADVAEVLFALAALHGITPDDIERERLRKRAERGGFDKMRSIIADRRGDDRQRKLQELLSKVRPATEEELEAQKLSWARGEAAMGNDRDEAEYRQALREKNKSRLAKLDAQATERMDKVGKITFEEADNA